MPFYPPSWVPKLTHKPCDSITVEQFMLDDEYRSIKLSESRPPFTCGLTGKSYTPLQVKSRVDHLSRALARELDSANNAHESKTRVIGLFSVNTIDTLTLAWATHRLGAAQTPANAAYSASELAYQLQDAGAEALFTCSTHLDIALEAARQAGIPPNRVFLMVLPNETSENLAKSGHMTIDNLIETGKSLPATIPPDWSQGEGAHRPAFLCYSSGTSGLPKGVMISHRNVIANVMQLTAFHAPSSHDLAGKRELINVLVLLPLSHIFGLVFNAHLAIYRGDGAIVLPKFDFKTYLSAIQTYRINHLYIVPPIIILMTNSIETVKKYDLSSVQAVVTGAAPLGEQTAALLNSQHKHWSILQGYGMTETSPVLCTTSPHDVMHGSSGSLVPGTSIRLVSSTGKEITEYDQPGEIWAQGPQTTLGYLNKPQATRETFIDGWIRTGDEAVVRKSPVSGHEHIFILDRLKELIKVNGLQVAPAELEAHLLTHPSVADCVVIGVPDDRQGEVPKAFVVKAASVGLEESERMLKREITRHVELYKAKHKWLKGGVEFIDAVPKSPSGKILRRIVRDKDAEMRKRARAKL